MIPDSWWLIRMICLLCDCKERFVHIDLSTMNPVRSLLMICFLCCVTAARAVVYELGSIRGFLYGSEPACEYDNWLSHVSEGLANPGLNDYAPWDEQSLSFGEYRTPTEDELLAWRLVTDAFCAGDMALVDTLLIRYSFPYKQVIFDDLDSGREYHMLRENLNDDLDDNYSAETWDDQVGSFDYGWGLYIRDPGSERNILVNCPHPKDDFPSVIMALEGFEKWNGRYFFIAGAGRETSYPYGYMPNNNYSVSDPSRVEEHPFNEAYQSAADQIREELGRMELSIQIHSYDWNSQNEPSVQLSAGNGRRRPQLPIKDYSRRKLDLIHQAPYIVHPAGSIGSNSEVLVDDYYSVHQSNSYPIYYQKDGYDQYISQNDSYPGAQYNKQMQYSTPDNLLDVESPFFHVEMDELPRCYDHSEESYYWFYGWDSETDSWDVQQRWSRFKEFYMRWIDDLVVVLNNMNPLNDYELPSTPAHLAPGSNDTIEWERSYCYDFDSYEFIMRYTDLSGVQVQVVIDRESEPGLAYQGLTELEDWDQLIQARSIINVRIRARDRNGDISPYSNSLLISEPHNHPIMSLSSVEYQGGIKLNWSTTNGSFSSTVGWDVYRSIDGLEYSLLASHTTDPSLIAVSHSSGTFIDYAVEPGQVYWYRVANILSDGRELISPVSTSLAVTPTFSLKFEYEQNDMSRLWNFSHQVGAEDVYSDYYDEAAEVLPEGYNITLVSQSGVGGNYLSKEVKAFFDPLTSYKEFCLTSYFPLYGIPVSIGFVGAPGELVGNLYLHDWYNNTWTDLRHEDHLIPSYNGNTRGYSLYWGAYRPTLELAMEQDISVYVGYNLDISWSAYPHVTVDSYSLYLSRGGMDFLVEENIPPDQNQLVWNVQGIEPGYSYKLKLTAHHRLSPDTEILSEHEVYVDASTYTAQYPQGWQTINIPVNSVYTTLYDLFGDYNRLYTINSDGTWSQVEEVVANRAYLLYLDQAQEKQWPSTIPAPSYTYQLQAGWNLVPNPYSRSISTGHLGFSLSGTNLSYHEMVDCNALAAGIFVLRDNALQPVWEVRPGEAFLMQVLSDTLTTLLITPELSHEVIDSPAIVWTGSLVFSDDQGSQTNVVIGSAELGTDELDEGLDYLPLPDLPGQSLHSVALQGEDGTEVLSAYTGLFPQYSTVEKTWALYLRKETDSPCVVKFLSEDIPAGYSVSLTHWGQCWSLIPGETLLLSLPSGESPLNLSVISNFSAAIDSVSTVQSLFCYPNPFRDNLSIDLNTFERGGSLEIYNIRGQLVRRETIVSEGRQRINWDGRDTSGDKCSSGIYIVRLRDGRTIQTLKLIKLN